MAMNPQERVQLDKMIAAGNVEDVTSEIRKKKHSGVLKSELGSIRRILADRAAGALDLTEEEITNMCDNYAPYMRVHYTDLFLRARKGDLDFDIMDNLIAVLERIENGSIDQHEGAHEVGTLLKRLYIDSALKRSDRLDDVDAATESADSEPIDVSYAQYKKRQQQIAKGQVRACARCGVVTPACELVRIRRKKGKKTTKVCKDCA